MALTPISPRRGHRRQHSARIREGSTRSVNVPGVLGFAVDARRRPVRTGAEQMIGSTSEVVGWPEDVGRMHVYGGTWEARSKQGFSKDQKVRVLGRTGLSIVDAGT